MHLTKKTSITRDVQHVYIKKCEHGRRRLNCTKCGGSGICEHGRRKSTCKKCGGASICEHGRRKSQCVTCTPKNACQNCFQVFINSKYRFKPYCFRCFCVLNPDVDIPRKYMIKRASFERCFKGRIQRSRIDI